MRRPVVGVIANAYRLENRFTTQLTGERNLRAVVDVAGALPLMFAGTPEITDIGALLNVVDGIVLTGARDEASANAVRAGAAAATVRIMDIDEVPLAYLPNSATRIRVKAVGDLVIGSGR